MLMVVGRIGDERLEEVAMEEDVKMNVVAESCTRCQRADKELKEMGKELRRVKDRILELEMKMGNISRFNLLVVNVFFRHL
ncbi:hypothetical protein SUGI_0636330 [Cryptomeria japonica]|nr:hypothetical protein SUGI_0636330 [Cryptomeria japonica]